MWSKWSNPKSCSLFPRHGSSLVCCKGGFGSFSCPNSRAGPASQAGRGAGTCLQPGVILRETQPRSLQDNVQQTQASAAVACAGALRARFAGAAFAALVAPGLSPRPIFFARSRRISA